MSPVDGSDRSRAGWETRRANQAAESTAPPDGWPSWAAFHRYLADADGGRAPYRQRDPLTIRTIAEAESEMA